MHFLMHYHFPAAWAFELSHAYAVTATHANHDLYLGWMVEAWMNSDYLKKCFPWHLLIALHRISKIILKRPEFSIQVIIYWNGTVEEMMKKKHTEKQYTIFKFTQECTTLENIIHFGSKLVSQ